MIYNILTERLVELWYPSTSEFVVPLGKLTLAKAMKFKARPDFVEDSTDKRPRSWHYGRVRFFVEEILAGKQLDPIDIDNECEGMLIYPRPTVNDGNHRLVAHHLTKRPTICAYYGGRTDLLKYLIGKRKTVPKD